MTTKLDYPHWVCSPCAEESGGKWPKGHVATFHSGICHVCGELRDITEPRDWRYPKLKVNDGAVELSRQYYKSLERDGGAEKNPGECAKGSLSEIQLNAKGNEGS